MELLNLISRDRPDSKVSIYIWFMLLELKTNEFSPHKHELHTVIILANYISYISTKRLRTT
jgi:hypothetical protein